MAYPIEPPLQPMLAKRLDAVPALGDFIFEPKWDGFRTMIFRDGDDLHLQSRDLKPLLRYFPELREPLLAALPERCVADAETVIATPEGLDFIAMQQRLHPAASRVNKLAALTPASIVLFDIMAIGDEDLRELPFEQRRARLEQAVAPAPPVHVTPITRDRGTAEAWFQRFEGAGLDGVMAKPIHGTYQPKKRAMFKVKHSRTADCVVAGFRWHKNGEPEVGSLVLALRNAEGGLNHVGVCASFSAKRRVELLAELEPYRVPAEEHPWAEASEAAQRRPKSGSRWNPGRSLRWQPLNGELVVEVKYDHMQGTRFRHTTYFVRWRPDKSPADCGYDQLEVTPPMELAQIFGL